MSKQLTTAKVNRALEERLKDTHIAEPFRWCLAPLKLMAYAASPTTTERGVIDAAIARAEELRRLHPDSLNTTEIDLLSAVDRLLKDRGEN